MSLPNRLDAIERHLHKLGTQVERRLDAFDVQLADHHRHLVQILNNQEAIMTKIGDFASKQSEFNERMDKAVTDLATDIKNLNDEILQLQNTEGNITAEDQALLDGIQTKAEALTQRVEALAAVTPAPVTP